MPRPLGAQTFTATSISQAAQQARRDVGALARRADNLLRQTVADGAERGGLAVRRFRTEQANLMRDLAAIFNGRVSEDDFLLIVPTRELDLVLTMQPLVIRIAPRPQEIEEFLRAPLPTVDPKRGDETEDLLLILVLAALGFKDDGSIAASLRDDTTLASAAKATGVAVKGKNYGLATFEIERLMRLIVLPRNITAIADHAGPEARRTLYRSLVAAFVPFVGWTLFVAQVLAAIYALRDGGTAGFR
ncbi:MAG: hypothetical protein JOZ70_03210 [Pseudolabrys sp.]|nr:hypothetical protein [Pseudolabrys sp.]MBV9954238.1 hypothetical protein [Pseudolabrys sp.]